MSKLKIQSLLHKSSGFQLWSMFGISQLMSKLKVAQWMDSSFVFCSGVYKITGVLSYHTIETSALPNLRMFLTMLVQNLTLRNDCNLIPSVNGTQGVVLSKWSLDNWRSTAFARTSGFWLDSNQQSRTQKSSVLTSRPQGIDFLKLA